MSIICLKSFDLGTWPNSVFLLICGSNFLVIFMKNYKIEAMVLKCLKSVKQGVEARPTHGYLFTVIWTDYSESVGCVLIYENSV